MTYFLNFSGHPAASIPAGLIDGRLPVGMQLIGGRYDDAGEIDSASAQRDIAEHYLAMVDAFRTRCELTSAPPRAR